MEPNCRAMANERGIDKIFSTQIFLWILTIFLYQVRLTHLNHRYIIFDYFLSVFGRGSPSGPMHSNIAGAGAQCQRKGRTD